MFLKSLCRLEMENPKKDPMLPFKKTEFSFLRVEAKSLRDGEANIFALVAGMDMKN